MQRHACIRPTNRASRAPSQRQAGQAGQAAPYQNLMLWPLAGPMHRGPWGRASVPSPVSRQHGTVAHGASTWAEPGWEQAGKDGGEAGELVSLRHRQGQTDYIVTYTYPHQSGPTPPRGYGHNSLSAYYTEPQPLQPLTGFAETGSCIWLLVSWPSQTQSSASRPELKFISA